MLADSGLTYQDVTAHIFKKGDTQSIFEAKTFRPGTVDEYGNIVDGDDVIIEYYDLDGMPVTYTRKLPGRGKQELKVYYRKNTGTRKGNRSSTSLLPAAVRPYTSRNA